MSQLRLLARLAMGAVRRQWRGTLGLAAGATLVAATVAAIPAFDGVLRDFALREALDGVELADLQVRVTRDGIPLDRTSYSNAQAESDTAVGAALAGAAGSQVRMGTTDPFALHEIDVVDGRLVSSLVGTVALRFRSGIEDRVSLVDGAYPEAQPRGGNDPIRVLVGADTAGTLGVSAGSRLALHSIGSPTELPTLVEVAGVAVPLDPHDPYWAGEAGLLQHAQGATFAAFVPEATFFGAVAELLGGVDASFEANYAIDASGVRASDALPLVERVRALETDPATLPGAHVQSELPRALTQAGAASGLDRPAIALLLGQVAAAAGAFVVWLSAHLAAGRRERHASLAIRGASPAQRAVVEALTVLPATLAALVLGPPLAAAGVAALGRLDAIGAFSGGAWLRFELTTEVLGYGALGALAAFALALASAALVTRRGAAARRPEQGGRRGLIAGAGALLLAAGGGGFWALTRSDHLFPPDGRAGAPDHALLLAPVALLLPIAAGGWWLLPHLGRLAARGAAISASVVWLDAFRTVARRHPGRAFAFALIAAAAAVLLATLPDSLDRSPGERASHAAGADVRAAEMRGLAHAGEAAFRAAVTTVPADATSPVARVDATLTTPGGSGESVAIELLGVEPETFGAVASVRDDVAAQPLDAVLGALATNSTALGGITAPPGTRQLGAWVRLQGIDGEVRVALSLTDAAGRAHELLLGLLRPGALVHWGFLAADLQTPIGIDGTPIGAPLEAPVTIHAYYALLSPEVAASAGGVSFGALVSTLDAPVEPIDTTERLVPRSTEFGRRAILHDLATTTGLEPIADLAAGGTPQTVRAQPPTAPGASGSTRLDWPAAPPGEAAVRVRGFRQETDGAPVLLYASRGALDDLGAVVGDELQLQVAGRYLNAQVAGAVEHFPTLGIGGGAFAVANLERLLAAANASPGAGLRSNEAWFATSTPAATMAALTGADFDAAAVVERQTELAALAGARTLARGWGGVLTLSFGVLLALAVLTVVLEGVAALRGAERPAAVAEVLGGSGGGQLAAVLLAMLTRLIAAAALGVGSGVVLARWLIDMLGTDPTGVVIVPPPRIHVALEPLLIVGGALALSFLLVVAIAALRYRGSSWSHALQLREA